MQHRSPDRFHCLGLLSENKQEISQHILLHMTLIYFEQRMFVHMYAYTYVRELPTSEDELRSSILSNYAAAHAGWIQLRTICTYIHTYVHVQIDWDH